MTTTLESEAVNRQANDAALIADIRNERHTETPSDFELTIINDAERSRWIAVLGAEGIGELTYRFVGGRVVLLKAWVDPSYRHHGVASELIAYALDEIKRTRKTITIICPVVGAFIAHHEEFANLIDKRHPGSGAHPSTADNASSSAGHAIAAFENDLR